MKFDSHQRVTRVPQKDRKLEAAKGYLATHPDATTNEVCLSTGVSERTVTAARAALIEAGILQPGMRGRPPSRRAALSPAAIPDTPEEVMTVGVEELARLEAQLGEPLDRNARRLRLSAIASNPKTPVAAQIAAIRELEATEAVESVHLGPPPPQTREERVTRVGLMLEALADFDGRSVVIEMLEHHGYPTRT